MIKPEAVAAGHAGKIIDMITSNGFKVIALKYTRLSREEAAALWPGLPQGTPRSKRPPTLGTTGQRPGGIHAGNSVRKRRFP